MLQGCMLEYLKGKTHEPEKKGCPLLAARGLFSVIHSFFSLIFLLKVRHYGFQHAFRCVIIMKQQCSIVVKYCTQ